MEIGTAEPLVIPEDEKKRGRAPLSRGGSGGNGGKRPGGGGGGDDGSRDSDQIDTGQIQPNKSRILTAFLLLVVLMTFGGLIAAYVVIATNGGAEWRPFELPKPVWVSTFLILISSLTYHIAKRSIDRNEQAKAKNFLIVTCVLGAAFISSQILAWFALVQRGFYVAGNPYLALFYILTAVHVVHVIGGIIALGVIVMKTWAETESEALLKRRRELAETVGWYWHFVDGMWIVLFMMLGFWK